MKLWKILAALAIAFVFFVTAVPVASATEQPKMKKDKFVYTNPVLWDMGSHIRRHVLTQKLQNHVLKNFLIYEQFKSPTDFLQFERPVLDQPPVQVLK